MKKKLFSLIIVFLFTFIIFNIFTNSLEINNTIIFSIKTFVKNIFPSLFPMFVIANILIAIGLPEFLSIIFARVMIKIFNVKGMASFIFFMSLISGYPSNAKYLKDFLDKKLINETDANKILVFTSFANPLFVINTIGIMFFNSKKIGLLLLISHILSNIIVGLLFRNIFQEKELLISKKTFKTNLKNFYHRINNTNIFKVFLTSINNALFTMLNILGIITCFLIVTTIISSNLKLNPVNNAILTGLLEFSSGLKVLSLIDASFKLKLYLSMFLISFGGFSVHAQIFNILGDYHLKYYLFFLARIIQALTSILLLSLLVRI